MHGRKQMSSWGQLSALALVAAVSALTFATRAHAFPQRLYAASAARIAAGRLWLLPTSALVVARPVTIGLVAFALLAAAALRCCGARTFWLAAVLGHAGSTLLVYAIIGSSQLADPRLFARDAVQLDFGVSAMQAAWVGAIAATAWSRAAAERRHRGLVVLGTCAIGAVAWWLHPDPSILTTEHLFAFLIGCGIVWLRPQWTFARAPRVVEG